MRRLLHSGWPAVRSLVGVTAVLYFVLALLSPMLLAAQDEAGVPACCRRIGAHRCVTMVTPGKRPAVSNGAHCPSWPGGLAASHGQMFTLSGALSMDAGFAPQQSIAVRNAEALRIARARQLALRGPPNYLLA